MAGFNWIYNLGGGRPLELAFFMKDSETLTKGDILNLESGEVDLAVTSDATLVGQMLGAFDPADEKNSSGVLTSGVVSGTDSTTRVKVIVNPDAVYETTDENDRDAGATLDITGATGAQTLTTSSNTEFVVVEDKNQASDKTRVMITPTAHYLSKT